MKAPQLAMRTGLREQFFLNGDFVLIIFLVPEVAARMCGVH